MRWGCSEHIIYMHEILKQQKIFFKETLGLKEKESNFSEAPHTL